MGFTKQNLNGIRNDINTALEVVAKKYGIELSIGNISFSATEFTTKITANVKEVGGMSLAQKTWNEDCKYFGLRQEDFGKVITVRGASYKIIGMNFKAKSYPVEVARTTDGKQFRLPAAAVRTALGIGA